MIRHYLDISCYVCAACEAEWPAEHPPRPEPHYCAACELRHGCCDCGCDAVPGMLQAPDVTPDGAEMWWRCPGCAAKADTVPAPAMDPAP